MKLFIRSLIILFLFIFSAIFFAKEVFALTTPFRSANIITTDGSTLYTNLSSCSATDGNTCDRASDSSYGNLYFRDFGTYSDFGMPSGSTITRINVRVTGKATASTYVGLSDGQNFSSNCQYPSDLWSLFQLNGNTINTQTVAANLTEQSYVPGTVLAYCLGPSNFTNKNFIFRINYSSSQSWSSNIDNFEIAFDYEVPITPILTLAPTPIPSPTFIPIASSTLTPTPTPAPTLTPGPTPTPTPTPIPKTPLILIPGIGGSELKTTEMRIWAENNGHGGTFTHVYPAGEKVWVNSIEAGKPGDDDYFDILRMQSDGQTSEANLALTGNLFELYNGTIDFFVSNGYTFNKDLFVFPYDWRKDISLIAPLLDQKINSIKQQTGSAKVDIISHSMGGLVARNYIADASRASKVRKLFTVGTPHLGAVEFLKAIRYGICLKFEIGSTCFSVNPSEVKDVLQNMISGFELSPSQEYFNFYNGQDRDHLYPYKDNDQVLNYDQIKFLLTSKSHNTSLFTPAEAFHSLDNSLSNTNGVEITNIAGSGIPTLGQIIEKDVKTLSGSTIQEKDAYVINGDKTVSLFSASLTDSTKNKSLLGNAKVFYTNQEHGSLVAFGPALNLVKNILNNNNQLPTGVSSQPYSFSGTQVSVHSPVNIHVYDSSGNHTGPTADGFETNIPGSSYDTLDDAKFIFLSDNGKYNIKLEATGQGSFDFKIRKYENNVNTSTILYNDVPLTPSTKAQVALDTLSTQPPILQIDQDGNGTTDTQVSSASGAFTDVAGIADKDINSKDKENKVILGILILSIIIVSRLLNRRRLITSFSFLLIGIFLFQI